MKLQDFYVHVQQHADTCKQGIDAADVSRVLATAFKVLNRLPAATLAEVLAKGLAKACK